MPATIKKLGKVASSPFGALTKSTPAKKNNKPILILIVVGGVAVIWYLRTHSSANTVGKSTTSAAVSINGGSAPDQSQIDNLTASILAMQGLVNVPSTNPGGGASTPITPTPIGNGNPGSGTQFLGPPVSNGSVMAPNTTDTTKPVNMTGTTPAYQAAIDKVASYGGSINSVGPLTDSSGNPASSSTNLSLVDWYKYQYAKVASAKSGTIVGESAAFLQHSPDPNAYLQDTLQGGNISMFGPNAGPAQKAQDAAASAQAKKELGIT